MEGKMTKRIVLMLTVFLALVTFNINFTEAFDKKQLLKPSQQKVLKPVVTKQLYTIKGGDFYHEAQNYGFNTNAHSLSFGSNCRESYRRDSYNYTDLLAEARNQIVGSKCDFTVFEPAKLKNGFVFKSFTGRRSKSSKADIELKSSPSSGGTSVKFVLHGWADPGNYAIYHIESITLEGPAGRDWRDALH
jgi:hypothetical protein